MVTAGVAVGFTTRWDVAIAIQLALMGGIFLVERLRGPVVDRWVQGAIGEEHVGRLLKQLEDDGWMTIHDVHTGRGNIDTIVIGPGGLFTVEVKSFAGKLRASDVRRADLDQAWAQKRWLEEEVGRSTDPLLVYSRAYLIGRGVIRQRGVMVLSARMLVGHLRRRPARLTHVEVQHLHHRLFRHAVAR